MDYKLPFEQLAKEEAEMLRISWGQGPSGFLLQRTQEKYALKANKKRRSQLEEHLNIALPQISDQMLLELYNLACRRHMDKCHQQYDGNSGFEKTHAERAFSNTLAAIIKDHPILKHLEVYPSHLNSKDLPAGFKTVIGNYVPDFLIFGIKTSGCSAVAVEIDGDSHYKKSSKDALRNSHLGQLKIFTWEIQNEQVNDRKYIESAILKMYRLRNGSLNDQILRAKRMIWVKTIACQLSLVEIDHFARISFQTELSLSKEAKCIYDFKLASRIIHRELKAVLS